MHLKKFLLALLLMIVLVHWRQDAFEEALAHMDDLALFWGTGTAFSRDVGRKLALERQL